ncbi:hypothetical protein VPH526E571_0014 [Vibrio phage 526E57-1]
MVCPSNFISHFPPWTQFSNSVRFPCFKDIGISAYPAYLA